MLQFSIQNASPKREKKPRRTGGCEMTSSWSDHVRIMLGSWSNRPCIGINASTVLGEFRLDFGVHFCVAGAVFGEVGG